MTMKERLERHAARMIARHCPDYTFGWDNAKCRLGCCSYKKRRITLSRHFLELRSYEDQCRTIAHEIAHALTEGDGHGRKWRAAFAAFGYTPSRTATVEDKPRPKWVIVDTTRDDQVVAEYYRKPRRRIASLYVSGRREETLGKLELRRATQ